MKIDRQKVYEKYNGHCAYCGKGITIKDMQVDHILPKRNGGTDDIDNLNPSCRLCNHYKRAADIGTFRNDLLGGLMDRLMKIYIFRVALDYGMITINGWDKKFYFEKNGTDKTGQRILINQLKMNVPFAYILIAMEPAATNAVLCTT